MNTTNPNPRRDPGASESKLAPDTTTTGPGHTPGPWTAGQVRETQVFDLIGPDVSGRGREVVGSLRASQNRATNEANARLIAAAPELLEALLHVSALESDANWAEACALVPELADAMEHANAAIAKAEGTK